MCIRDRSTLAAKTQSVVFSVIDYYGKTIFTDNVSIECGKFNYKIDLGKHPTGYFTLKATLNNNELYKKVYIVTPDIQTRTIYQNSPFAMDFASYHTLDNANDSYMYASACKLMGISWVRERYESYAKWYEGQYDFSRSDIISVSYTHLDVYKRQSLYTRVYIYVQNQYF